MEQSHLRTKAAVMTELLVSPCLRPGCGMRSEHFLFPDSRAVAMPIQDKPQIEIK